MKKHYENAILAGFLLSEGVGFKSFSISKEDFTGTNREIFETITKQYEAGGKFDALTVSLETGRATDISEILNTGFSESMLPTYITGLQQAILTEKVEHIRTVAAERIQAGDDIVNIAMRVTAKIEELQNRYGEKKYGSELSRAFNDILGKIASGEKSEALEFGFPPADHLTGGVLPGESIILAGRPSCGKTAFCLNLLKSLAEHSKKSALFSLEMGAPGIAGRLLGQVSFMDSRKAVRRPDLLEDPQRAEFLAYAPAIEALCAQIELFSTCGTNFDTIRRLARKAVSRGAKFLALDYVQLLEGIEGKLNRNSEIEKISRGWKALLRELHVPGLLLSQLSRKCEEERRLPVLSDLRDSGSIEQDADIVWFLSPVYPKNKNEMPNPEQIRLIQAKGRDHGIGFKRLIFKREIQTFFEEEVE